MLVLRATTADACTLRSAEKKTTRQREELVVGGKLRCRRRRRRQSESARERTNDPKTSSFPAVVRRLFASFFLPASRLLRALLCVVCI